jgi:hypothetical protein
LSRVQSEPKTGAELYKFLMATGEFMRQNLHNQKMGTDQISSIEIDRSITDRDWEIIKNAVGLGLLYPNITASGGDQMPERIGIYRLAYVLSPAFRILPRKGKSVALHRIFPQMNLPLLS